MLTYFYVENIEIFDIVFDKFLIKFFNKTASIKISFFGYNKYVDFP